MDEVGIKPNGCQLASMVGAFSRHPMFLLQALLHSAKSAVTVSCFDQSFASFSGAHNALQSR